jgi:hypothetical protein
LRITISISFLLLTTLLSGQQPDSLVRRPIPLLPAVRVFTVPERELDSSAGHDVQASVYSNQLDMSPETMFFYNNLKESAERTYITRWLHKMLVREPGFVSMPATYSRRSEMEFSEYRGKTIRNIDFSTASLFAPGIDVPYYSPATRLEQVGLLLHVNTNERIIRNNILFKTGDRLNPYIMADNERILRQLSYIEDARIYILEDVIDPDIVDVVVVTKDRWSRGVDMDMSEIDEGRFEVYDKNIFGLGQEVQANLLFDGKKEQVFGYQAKLIMNNIGGSFIRTGIDYLNHMDHKMINIRSVRNFLTPSMKYAGGFEFKSTGLTDDFVYADTSFLNQRLSYNVYDYWFGRSFLFPVRNDNLYSRKNLYITSRFNRDVFFERPETDANSRYEFHNKNLFMLGLTYTRLGYLKSRYIYGFGPTEDIPIGSKIETTMGYEDNQFFPAGIWGLVLPTATT